jgi:hypothetical protein
MLSTSLFTFGDDSKSWRDSVPILTIKISDITILVIKKSPSYSKYDSREGEYYKV